MLKIKKRIQILMLPWKKWFKAFLKEWDQHVGLELICKETSIYRGFQGRGYCPLWETSATKENKFVSFHVLWKKSLQIIFIFLIKFDYQSKIRGGVSELPIS